MDTVKQSNETSSGLYLIAILVIVAILRIVLFDTVFASNAESVVEGDSLRYETPALSLIRHGNYYAHEPKENLYKDQTLRNPPGYSFFIASIYSASDDSRYTLIIMQIMVSLFSAWLLYLIASLIWSKKIGLIAATLLAVEPLQIYYSQVIMSEILSVPATLLFILFSIHMLANKNGQRYKYALLMGITLAAATLIRSINYHMIFFVILGFVLLKPWIGLKFKELVVIIMLMLVPFSLAVGAWHIRNGQLTGAYVFTDNQGALLLPYKASAVLAFQSGRTAKEEFEYIKKTMPVYSSLADKYEHEKKKGMQIIKDNLSDYVLLSLENIPHIILSPGFDELRIYGGKSEGRADALSKEQQTNWIQTIESKLGYKIWYLFLEGALGVYLLSIYILMLYGIVKTKMINNPYLTLHLLILGVVLFYIVMSTGISFAYSRLRTPLMPFFILYASYGLSLFWESFLSYQNKSQIPHKEQPHLFQELMPKIQTR